MKEVKAYQTEDGAIHETKGAAVTREFEINIRGLIHRNKQTHHIMGNSAHMAEIISKSPEELEKAFALYKKGMSLAKRYDKKIS